MKPVWIVDDDQSIRFVLEKALLREQLPTRSFSSAADVLRALASSEEPRTANSDQRHPHAGRVRSGVTGKSEGTVSEPAGDHHDRVFRPRQRRSARSKVGHSSTCPNPLTCPKPSS